MPTIALKEEDKAYAVSFAVPSDAAGITMIYGRQSCDTRKLEGEGCMDCGNCKFGGQEALVVFDRVFVPWDRVFLCEEYEFAGILVERFAGYHRQSYGGCKAGVGDVLIGAAAVAAEYNGVEKASHVKDKTDRNDALERNALLLRHRLFRGRKGNGFRQLSDRQSVSQCM